ncbi:hypothetical protein KY289_030406 [Solanum tuberosum]|nr:hypothetical protein KY289_030406 [Solanum tuberosum]
MDKSWIGKPHTSNEYLLGLDKFLDFAFKNAAVEDTNRCPCPMCCFGKWKTRDREEGLKTQNSGVFLTSKTSCVASTSDGNLRQAEIPYYGKLEDIIEINYNGRFKVVLFKCKWADTRGESRISRKRLLKKIEVNCGWLGIELRTLVLKSGCQTSEPSNNFKNGFNKCLFNMFFNNYTSNISSLVGGPRVRVTQFLHINSPLADTTRDRGYQKDRWNLNCVNFDKLIHTGEREEHEPYIEASQAQLVFYVDDIVNKGWSVAVHLKPRDMYDMGEVLEEEVDENEPYQEQELEQFFADGDDYVQLATDHIINDIVDANVATNLATDAMSEWVL